MKVNPADLRFTQDTIAAHFKDPYDHFSVMEALEQIQAGKIRPDTFPKLRVYSYNGVLWSVDNRRLWVFRMAKCPEITVKMMNTMHPRLDGVINFPSRHRRLSKADFLPRVRGSQNLVVPKKLHPQVADIMARYDLSGQVRGSENGLPLANTASKDLISRVEGDNVREIERQPVQAFRVVQANALVVKMEGLPVGSVYEYLRPESSKWFGKEVPKLSFPSFPKESGGRHVAVSSSVTANPIKPPRKAIVDIGCSYRHEVGIQAEQRHPEKTTCTDSPLLFPASIDHNDTGPKSSFGWVTDLIFGCFGSCG